MKNRGREETVQGRSGGRKDRHSKVFTARGTRDRRLRLSAQTAIQFYDVQDRLGYDQPSKAMDWLITKAKTAIDELDNPTPFDPSASGSGEAAATEHYLDAVPFTAGSMRSFFPVSSGASLVNFQADRPVIPMNFGANYDQYVLSSHSMAPPPQPFLCESSAPWQRGPLQSTFSPSPAIQPPSVAGECLLQYQIHGAEQDAMVSSSSASLNSLH